MDTNQNFNVQNHLRELNENLNQAQRVAGVGSWRYDITEDKFFGSDEMFRIYNIRRSDHIDDFYSTLQLIHPEDREKISKALEQNLQGKPSDEIFRIPQSDGAIKYVHSKAEPIFNERGEVKAIQGIIQDITEITNLEKKLKKSHKMLSIAEELAHIGSWEADVRNKSFTMSDEAYRIYGISKDEFDNSFESMIKLIHPEDLFIINYFNGESMEQPTDQPFEAIVRIIRPDGTIRHVSKRIEIKLDNQGNIEYIYGTVQDITEKIELQQKLEQQRDLAITLEQKFQRLVEKSNDVLGIINVDGTIVYVSEACESILGYKITEVIGSCIYEHFDNEDRKKLQHLISSVIQEPTTMTKDIVVLMNPYGQKIYLEVHLQNLLNDPIVNGIVVHVLDVTSRIEMEEKIIYINDHDEITDLPNRNHLNKYIDHIRKNKENTTSRFAFMLLDIIGLKNVNYTFGYNIGDHLVIMVVERIKEYFGQEIYISRYSDDHLALIISEHMSYKRYEELVKEILRKLSDSFVVDNYEINISANIGICVYPDSARDNELLIKNAKAALFRTRKDGNNSYRFYSRENDMDNDREIIIRSDLNKAILKDQLRLNYQPMVNLKTDEILAAEALIRWEHPELGLIPPNMFIPIAEETGFIIKIGDWILEQVCSTYKQWMSKGYPAIKVSINFSSIQFFENNFAEKVVQVIRNHDLDPKFLIVEITESIFMDKFEKAVNDIKALQSYGIQVALDDFGTGYSSLAYLNSFHINILKIDKSFIQNIPSDFTSSAIINGIVTMAKDLKIKLVAEGIETLRQLTVLQELNCHTGQGYLFSRPINRDAFERVLSSGHCKPVPFKV